jgi:hypothetical protein
MKQRHGKRMPGAFMDEDEYSEDDIGRQMRLERMR